MSSRCISISLRGPLFAFRATAAFTPAWAAFTREDLPIPRAPHKRALLAGKPLAKRSVFSTRTSRTRSIPLSSDISTRLTRGTGARRPSGCHTNASAALRSGSVLRCGDNRSTASARRSNRSAWPEGRAGGVGLGVEGRGDLDCVWVSGPPGNRVALGGGAFPPQGACPKRGGKGEFFAPTPPLQLGARQL